MIALSPAAETIHRFAPLGIDFWDILSDAPITDGLIATATVSGVAHRPLRSQVTPAGVHAFIGIPGLRDIEFPKPGSSPPVDDLPSSVSLLVDVLVIDRLGRFLPTAIRLEAPKRGLATASDALAGCPPAASLPEDAPVFLMSAPTRDVPSTVASIRAQIVERATGIPAAHAVVGAEVGGTRWVGFADGEGSLLLPFPYPGFAGALPGSLGDSIPAGSHGVPTDTQHWTVTIDVRWEPAVHEIPAITDVPHMHSLLCQAGAEVWNDVSDASATNQLATELRYGRDLVLSTAGAEHAELLIDLSP